MRSNDAWAGFRNDLAWQKEVLRRLSVELQIEAGDITWQVGSLHVYDRQFYLVDYYRKTGATAITKEEYRELYPNSHFK
jgi:thymidylate synthase